MSRVVTADFPAAVSPLARLRDQVGIYNELSKARLSTMVVLTAMAGFVLGSGASIDWPALLLLALGVGMAAGSANAFNQVMEADRDRRMHRTQDRPMPTYRIGRGHAVGFAILNGLAAVVLLSMAFAPLVALLTGLNIVLYAAIYTPLKTRTTLNTVVGAIVGAVPPAIGWVAATGQMGVGGWVLAALLFVWQMPHFLALAWMYRADYERGGYRMLPSIDPAGRLTAQAVLLYALALVPVGLGMTLVGVSGWISGLAALLLGGWLAVLSVGLWRYRTTARARRLFLASVIYLPLLMAAMVLDRQPLPEAGEGPAASQPVPVARQVTLGD